MEKVLHLDPWQTEACRRADLSRFDAAMTGSEFCQYLVPSDREAAALAKAAGGRFILATPIMTDKAMSSWRRFVRSNLSFLSEVVVNDWGFAAFLKKTGKLRLSAGRLMMRELSLLEPSWASGFLREHRIMNAEADRPDLAAAAKRLGLGISWHGGRVFRAVTTYCPFERHFGPSCGRSCAGNDDKLLNRELGHPLFLSCNAYFSASAAKTPRKALRAVLRPAGSGPA